MNPKKILLLFLQNRQKHPKKLNMSEVKSILIRPLGDAIGDAAVHTAHIKQLKEAFPHIKIGVLVTKNNRTVFEYSYLADELIERNFFNYIKNYKKWDLLLDFENNFNSASLFMDRVIMPKWIMIFRKYNKKYYNFNTVRSFDFYSKQDDSYPLSHYISNSQIADQAVLPAPYSVLKANDKASVNTLWNKNTFRLLLCPQGSKRQIPPMELANFLTESIPAELTNKIHCIISYTSSSEVYFNELKQYCSHLQLSLSPKTALPEYFSLIESADFVIAVDGGSLHLACAFNKPLISFFADCQPNLGTWTPLINPNFNIPHFKILTQNTVPYSNDTYDFDLETGKIWFNDYLINMDK